MPGDGLPPPCVPRGGRLRRGRSPAAACAVLALATVLQAGCSAAVSPCTGAADLEAALGALGGRGWHRLVEDDVVMAWPGALARETDAAAYSGDGAALPYRLWARVERQDRHGCVCCQALEFGSGAGEAPSLRVVSLRLAAPSWAEASRTAARLLLAGLPPHVSVELSIPPSAPDAAGLPWEVSSAWTSDPDPDGRVLAGSALLQIDRGPGGWIVFVRHERPGR